jgi:sulfate adenylyltransferase subunit 2
MMLSQYDVGTIPIAVDRVGAGEMDRMRRRNLKHLIVLGADDERLPKELLPQVKNRMVRFRTLGCWPLTGAVESEAATIEEIVEEMMTTTKSERTTRVIDFDQEASMEQKKREGYF